MDFVFKTMDSVLKMMDFVFKMMISMQTSRKPRGTRSQTAWGYCSRSYARTRARARQPPTS